MKRASGRAENNPVEYINNSIRYYLGRDPDTLNDQDWAVAFKQVNEIRKSDGR